MAAWTVSSSSSVLAIAEQPSRAAATAVDAESQKGWDGRGGDRGETHQGWAYINAHNDRLGHSKQSPGCSKAMHHLSTEYSLWRG